MLVQGEQTVKRICKKKMLENNTAAEICKQLLLEAPSCRFLPVYTGDASCNMSEIYTTLSQAPVKQLGSGLTDGRMVVRRNIWLNDKKQT